MANNTLIIYDSVKYFINLINDKNVRTYQSFKPVNKFEKILRKVSFITNIAEDYWYGTWKNKLKDVDTVIIFATNRYDFIEYIADNYPKLRVIIWFWNPVFRCFNPKELQRDNIEYWSFDKDDCKKFGINFNSTFYFNNLKIENSEILYDVLFLGADKGRMNALNKLKEELTSKGLITNFHIVPDKNSPNPNNIKPINYEDYLKYISKSKVILDYIQVGQKGLTLRPMESIFFNKKLITNDLNIIDEDFYHPQNIFILGKDDINNIKEFINTPYFLLDDSIVQKYDFANWLKRF